MQEVINVQTKKESDELLKIFEKKGLAKGLYVDYNYSDFAKNTCIENNDGWDYANLYYAESHNETVITFQDYLKRENIKPLTKKPMTKKTKTPTYTKITEKEVAIPKPKYELMKTYFIEEDDKQVKSIMFKHAIFSIGSNNWLYSDFFDNKYYENILTNNLLTNFK